MRILLTNDDGVRARGLSVLERIARSVSDDVWTVAPAEEQSGKGRSLTLSDPVRIRRIDDRRHAVAGTPTDSVMMALAEVMKDARPDLILSGVNRGANLAEDVSYSGTVSAAMEGALAGIRSIAFSQVIDRTRLDEFDLFDAAAGWGERVLRTLIDAPMAPRTLFNVNFPALPAAEVKGVRVVAQGLRDYGRLKLDRRTDPRGNPYFWFGLASVPQTPAHATDVEAVIDGHIAVTPLHLDLTHHASLNALAGAFGE